MQNAADFFFFFFFFWGGGGVFYQCEEYLGPSNTCYFGSERIRCMLHIILLRAQIFTKSEILV